MIFNFFPLGVPLPYLSGIRTQEGAIRDAAAKWGQVSRLAGAESGAVLGVVQRLIKSGYIYCITANICRRPTFYSMFLHFLASRICESEIYLAWLKRHSRVYVQIMHTR